MARGQTTRDFVIDTAVTLFNEQGTAAVSTNHIAEAAGISPGNLYYHFHSKDEIIESLFADFERGIEETLAVPVRRNSNVEDIWLYLHLVFEGIWRHRFLYRDINELLSRNRLLEVHFKRILAHKVKTAAAICEGLVATGDMKASTGEIQTLAVNMTVLATYWLSFEFVREPRKTIDASALARGAFQVMSLAAPYLQGRSRSLFERLAKDYLST